MKTLLTMAGLLCVTVAHVSGQTPPPVAAWSRTLAAPEDRGTPAERGAAVFNNWCSACHSRDVRNAPGTTSLRFKYQDKVPAALEDRRDLTPQSIALFVRQGVAMMPFSRKTEVSDADLNALIAYLTRR
jgi:cytochrome c5